MIQDFSERDGLPCLDGINRWRARMALNNVCLFYSFQIELVPILRCLLQHCIHVRRTEFLPRSTIP